MTATALQTPVPELGRLLKHWRQVQGMSQLDLALDAGSSARHLSFIETGRSNASREMVLRLSEALALSLRERNRLLNAAGYTAAYRARSLDDAGFGKVREALDFMLQKQEPYPAIVMNRSFDVLMINQAGAKMLALLGLSAAEGKGPPNTLRLMLHPEGLRPVTRDWDRAAGHLIERAHRQLKGAEENDPLRQLLAEVLAYPGVPESFASENPSADALPVLPLEFELGGNVLSWITTVASFGTPQDVTAEEIMVESFFPADATTDKLIRALVGEAGN
ncbi:helix-turn-helix transcriptional regulator [Sneathiella sp.]|uniref:helix-turn-helix domain-containing protein n=1 Tax=Sneathiella sp. TaxID=1964365 RepID=UPI00262DDC4A|nr:helix-turn-helix transcriptional regulator [Sneathiella sp.]MDF2367234.1 helix-turn-helix transcriptional regulator [Sneathiella sp.]